MDQSANELVNKFVYPKYNGQSLLNVPSTILSLFGVSPLKETLPEKYYQNAVGAEKVILFLIDGLGDNLFQKEALKYPFFKNIVKEGFYQPITSIFPSTTAAALTTLNSGLSLLEHGLPEWHVYFQELDLVIQTLPYIPTNPLESDKLPKAPTGLLFNQETIYQRLNVSKVNSFTFMHQSYLKSPYNQTASLGSKTITYKTIADLLVSLRHQVSVVHGKAFYFVYLAAVDTAEHNFGPYSKETAAEISLLAYMLQEEFVNRLSPKVISKSSLILTSDHGQISTNPANTIYLDEILGFNNNLEISKKGKKIPPSGSSRAVILHIKKEKIESTIKLLKEKLGNKAKILKTEKVINQGLFGWGKMHQEFRNRIGDLLILPTGSNTIWYHFNLNTKFELLGHHGGLTKEEMMIPFACARLSELRNI